MLEGGDSGETVQSLGHPGFTLEWSWIAPLRRIFYPPVSSIFVSY